LLRNFVEQVTRAANKVGDWTRERARARLEEEEEEMVGLPT
jgi:hypothetical protein